MTQKNDEWNNKHLAKTTQPDFYQFDPFYRLVDIKLEGYCQKGDSDFPTLVCILLIDLRQDIFSNACGRSSRHITFTFRPGTKALCPRKPRA